MAVSTRGDLHPDSDLWLDRARPTLSEDRERGSRTARCRDVSLHAHPSSFHFDARHDGDHDIDRAGSHALGAGDARGRRYARHPCAGMDQRMDGRASFAGQPFRRATGADWNDFDGRNPDRHRASGLELCEWPLVGNRCCNAFRVGCGILLSDHGWPCQRAHAEDRLARHLADGRRGFGHVRHRGRSGHGKNRRSLSVGSIESCGNRGTARAREGRISGLYRSRCGRGFRAGLQRPGRRGGVGGNGHCARRVRREREDRR